MKTLYESIFDIEDNIENLNEDPTILINGLFNYSLKNIGDTINTLKNILDKNKAKIHKTSNKIKMSDKFFIQIPNSKGYTYDLILLKKYGSNWYVFTIDTNARRVWSLMIESWQSLQPNLSPKVSTIYEVPSNMEKLCDDILNKSEKYR
jgi:hypothetical protein